MIIMISHLLCLKTCVSRHIAAAQDTGALDLTQKYFFIILNFLESLTLPLAFG
jgi:hypothetical protein